MCVCTRACVVGMVPISDQEMSLCLQCVLECGSISWFVDWVLDIDNIIMMSLSIVNGDNSSFCSSMIKLDFQNHDQILFH